MPFGCRRTTATFPTLKRLFGNPIYTDGIRKVSERKNLFKKGEEEGDNENSIKNKNMGGQMISIETLTDKTKEWSPALEI
jgi:hypothetical protein